MGHLDIVWSAEKLALGCVQYTTFTIFVRIKGWNSGVRLMMVDSRGAAHVFSVVSVRCVCLHHWL